MAEARGLTIGREALVDLSAAVASREERSLRRALVLAARFAPLPSIDEVLLQSHLFVGFPIALEAFAVWRSVAPPVPCAAEGEEMEGEWVARGEDVCRTVYGSAYDKLRANVGALHPQLDHWMVAGGYGRVIGRPGLDLATRELCIVALLAVWDAPRQLRSHLHGALNAGASVGEVSAALTIAARHLGPARVKQNDQIWSKVRRTARSSDPATSGVSSGYEL